ncbi:protein phosphatase 1 regulatory subunit 21-like [Planococcus citri]|uniref:protein phosphatase 1 regulatory subunit 21-like n=1 Tax=Planococcus citri TaxID=170843 RepID=UPI0031F759D3
MSDNSSEHSVIKENCSDTNAKFSRLAAEYSKIRAQNAVLKKAVLEEQSKNVELNEKLKDKEQIVRKSDQEMESLNFRNSQLTRRIAVLQEEIENISKSGKKKSKNASDTSNGVFYGTVMDEELKKTMIENAKLLSQLNEKEEKHQEEISIYKTEIYALKHELEQSNLKFKQLLADHQSSMEQMKKEQQEYKRDFVNKMNKLKETEIELSTLKKAHKSYVNDVGPKLEAVSEVISKRIPFLDEKHAALNKLNVRCSTNSYEENMQIESLQNYFAALLFTFYNIIHNVTLELKQLGFEELKIYIKTLLKEDDGVLLNEKLNACYQLLKNIGLDCNISESMEYSVHQFMKSFLDLSSSIYSSYMNKNKTKSAGLVDYSNDVSIKNCLQTFQKKKTELIEKIMKMPNSQQTLIKEEFGKLDIAINNLIMEIDSLEQKRVQLSNQKLADTYEFKKRATDYLRSLRKDKVERIPYKEGIENKRKMQEYIMLNNALKDEIHALEKSIVDLEKEKIDLQNQFSISLIKQCNEDIKVPTNLDLNSSEIISEEIGKIKLPYDIPEEILAREEEIKNHLNEKITELIVLKQEATSKARMFMFECRVLQRRLENCIVEKQLMENKYLKFNKSTLELQEKLSTISQNYEGQLSMLSEHLANVNDKLASQTEEIDNLRYQINNKSSKKTKQK